MEEKYGGNQKYKMEKMNPQISPITQNGF